MPTNPSRSEATMPRRQLNSPTLLDGLLAIAVVVILGLWVYTRSTTPRPDQEHAHLASQHGGILIELEPNRYQAEVWIEQDDTLRLMTLGQSASEIIDVESQELVAYVDGGDGSVVPVPLQPEPQAGDEPGRTSQFVGRLPSSLMGRPISATVAALQIEGRRYRLGFSWPPTSSHQPPMPEKVHDEAERDLYLTPGGRYTLADIQANGGVTASTAFAGFKAQHDFDPRPGDQLCPVTRTKANLECGWIIGGQRYTFCCPPCIDEFLTLAKERPEEVQAPAAYVKSLAMESVNDSGSGPAPE